MPNPTMGGPGMGQDMMANVKANQSVTSPADVSMMLQDGEISPDMPVLEYLKKIGIDPNGPVSQFVDVFKAQQAKASPMGKMQAFSGGPRMGAQKPPAGPPPGMAGLIGG